MIDAQDKCDSALDTCASCVVSCAKCGERVHSLNTFLNTVQLGARPRFVCKAHDGAKMQTRVRAALGEMPPNVRRKRELAEAKKRRLAQLMPVATSCFQTHSQQAARVESVVLGCAAASPSVRLAECFAAALQDDGAGRAETYNLVAFVADNAAPSGGGFSVPPPSPFGARDVSVPRQTVVDAVYAALSKRSRYSPDTRAALRGVSREAELVAASTRDARPPPPPLMRACR